MNNDSQVLPTASPFGRYERCPASWQLEQEAKRIGQEAYKKSAAADSGDRKHGWLAGQPVELLPLELEDAQFLKERGDDQVTRIFGDAQTETLVEQRLWMELNGQPALSGRFDRVIWDGKIALIQDYKTGRSEPDHAEQNSQLKVLAVLFALNYRRVEEVIVQIVSRSHGVTEARSRWRSWRRPITRSSPPCGQLTIRTRPLILRLRHAGSVRRL